MRALWLVQDVLPAHFHSGPVLSRYYCLLVMVFDAEARS
jgi:hypothetical protein